MLITVQAVIERNEHALAHMTNCEEILEELLSHVATSRVGKKKLKQKLQVFDL